jgi:hypothetical protein
MGNLINCALMQIALVLYLTLKFSIIEHQSNFTTHIKPLVNLE